MLDNDKHKEQTNQNNGVVPVFQKKRKGRDREGLRRKKPNVESITSNKDDHSDEDEDETEDIRSMRDYLISQQKKQTRLVPDVSSDHYNKKDDQNLSTSKDINVEYSANLNVHGDDMNTSTVTIPNESSNDEDSIGSKKGTLSSDLFQSQNEYSKFLPKKEPISKKAQSGPVRPSPSSAAIRTITVIDYQPDVCKDYKLTGFCGYGDTCKFLHMREDYKAGWQLDQEWNEAQSKFRKGIRNVDGVPKNEKEEEIPFVCLICKKDYKNPIVTICRHHFCESCAVEQYRKSPTCVQCGADTKGLFSIDKQMNLLLKKKNQEKDKNDQPKEIDKFQPISKENLVGNDKVTQEEQDKKFGQPNFSDTTSVASVASNKPSSRYSLVELSNDNINSFKRLNQVVLNTNYSETFYKSILKDNELSRVALFENKVVGGLSCIKNKDEILYIATFSVLAPYRNLGIGSALLDFANRSARRLAYNAITLHVRCSNEDSVNWYTRRGFNIIERVPKLYKRFGDGDSDAFLMRHDLNSQTN
ncbi:zf-C3HC4 type /GCN5-like N acetyltransferase fusion protein [Schizosaccharomyces octosporus yFS286]|uniref:Zf-C3HC4 type /GCN5-like N acetyltransferase fusion protein n=1 Tax=Schizosaccharomyces octosporus (strain yFS286) TaxID=483514 RepID=S9PTK1_SCHOY|nr:zf-C3HC4 type /GCN5-like N acetyltransferase fusion protein [Schizosaccharomyces octosporus yFS286]EPX72466.1 zf-C3HC4 type /GCN5-like N acetyltransferase fusion protein [Schizosaccharomyces octosporus yFS286]